MIILPDGGCGDNGTTGDYTQAPWSQRREAKAIVKNVTVQPIKPVYVTLVFVWNSLAGMLLLPKLQLLVCSIILPVVALPAFLCNTVTI